LQYLRFLFAADDADAVVRQEISNRGGARFLDLDEVEKGCKTALLSQI
jgi:hypothetical protein